MSRILEATCSAAGVVKIADLPITDAVILSQGKNESTGILIVEGRKSYYVASSALDIKSLITSLVSIIQQIELIATTLDAVTVSPGTSTAAVVALGVMRVQLNLSKDLLI